VFNHQIDDIAPVAGAADAPVIEDHRRQSAPAFTGQVGQAPGQFLAADVTRLVGFFIQTELFDSMAQAFKDKLHGAGVIPSIITCNLFDTELGQAGSPSID